MLHVIGIGPGGKEDMTLKAWAILKEAEVVVGYKTYIDLVLEDIKDKAIVVNGMKKEVERCQEAINQGLLGKNVVVISSGDPGVYAMAGLILDLIAKQGLSLEVNIVPGITSANGGAALLGAPIMHDHAYISLSDLLTDFELIKKRLKLASEGDFVICLFNPKSVGRPHHINKAQEIIKKYKSGNTPVGIVKNVGRKNQMIIHTTLDDMLNHPIDMTTMVIVGNKETYKYNNYMITPRGYKI